MNDAPIDFYFDFASPYAYLASEKIDDLAARYGRKVRWHPILLGVVFKSVGTVSLTQQTDKAGYSVHDFARSARYLCVPYAHPATFPVATVAAARAYYWLHGIDCEQARRFAHGVFRAYFAQGQDVTDTDVLLGIAADAGAAAEAVGAGMQEAAIKERLRSETEAAIARGVFGAPWIVVDNEPFWGADRLPQIEKWLETGGF